MRTRTKSMYVAISICLFLVPLFFVQTALEQESPFIVEDLTKYIHASDVYGKTLYAGSKANLYKSEDNGKTWTFLWTVPGNPSYIKCVFVNSKGYIFVSALGTHKLYRSTNGGVTFYEVPTVSDEIWGMDEDSLGNLYAGRYFSLCMIYKSVDDGLTWTVVYNDPNMNHVHDVKVNPLNDWIYATVGDKYPNFGVLRSKDHGLSWSKIIYGRNYIAIAFKDNYTYIGSDAGEGNTIERFIDDGTSGPFNPKTILSLTGDYDCQVYWGRRNQLDTLFFGTVVPGSKTKKPSVFASKDGQNFTRVAGGDFQVEYGGFAWASVKFNSEGWLFVNWVGPKGLGIRIKEIVPSPPVNCVLTITTSVGGTTTPAPGSYTLQQGQTQQVTAIPDANYRFANWTLDGTIRTENPIIVTMDKNYTLQATFEYVKPPVNYTLTVNAKAICANCGAEANCVVPVAIDGTVVGNTPIGLTILEGIHTVEVPSFLCCCNFTVWEDMSTNPVRTLNVQSDMNVNVTYTCFHS